MTGFPNSPKVIKGAIIGIDKFNPVASVIVFQYNPETVTRTLQINTTANDGGNRSEPTRLKGAPTETLRLDVEIDATDQLASGDSVALSMGIYPQLSALEMLLYPKSGLVIANTVLAALGSIEVIPPEAVFTMLVWGGKRVLPIKINDFSITEEAHDINLNPIRAKVSLGLRVLSYNDFPVSHPGYSMFLTHQIVKETMAVIGSVSNLGSVSATGFSI